VTFGQRLARFTTDVVVRWPRLWGVFRGLTRRQFDAIAPKWNTMRMPDSLAPFEAALAAVEAAPSRALDLGTGTGVGARAVAERFPAAEVVGADLSERMLAEARQSLPKELEERVRFEAADASALPYDDGSFDLVTLANMIPFFDELGRVTAPGGSIVFAYSGGTGTPIYVPPERLRAELERRGFADFAEFQAGRGTSLLARKPSRV
jgi:SAM-dependent methyltransferase